MHSLRYVAAMSEEESYEMGPIDYILVEWPDQQPNGEAAPCFSIWSTAA